MDEQSTNVIPGGTVEGLPAAVEGLPAAVAPVRTSYPAVVPRPGDLAHPVGSARWEKGLPRVVGMPLFRIRIAQPHDVFAVDRIQKQNGKALGFLPRMAIEAKQKAGQILIAWEGSRTVGYLMAADRYMKRDEVGLITQIGVEEPYRRSNVAATLLQAQFDRSAWGCRLYSCWCAQDLEANRFWEAMGFVPIAFRAGARKRVGRGKGDGKEAKWDEGRIHIFWQKRIRPGDESTDYWYPSRTAGGEIREDRLVFPIGPGTDWREVMAVALPPRVEREATAEERKAEEAEVAKSGVESGGVEVSEAVEALRKKYARQKKEIPWTIPREQLPDYFIWGFWTAEERDTLELEALVAKQTASARRAALRKRRVVAPPLDPRLAEEGRLMRDWWQEEIAPRLGGGEGKYDLRRLPVERGTVSAGRFEAA